MDNQAYRGQLPLAGGQATNVNTQKHPRQYYRCLPPRELDLPDRNTIFAEDEEDDFPTPRANTAAQEDPMSYYSPHRQTFASDHTEFEEDAGDASSTDRSEIVPFKLSHSIRRNLNRPGKRRSKIDTLVIPSPGLWPTIGNSSKAADWTLVAVPRTPLSPSALARLNVLSMFPPPPLEAPSLTEGSSITDEAPVISCPPTPSLGSVQEGDSEWGSNFHTSPVVGCELPEEAMHTLMRLSSEITPPEISQPEVQTGPAAKPQEMSDKGLSISLTDIVGSYEDDEDELSPISVPSPGGFFSGPRKSSEEVWTMPELVESTETPEHAQEAVSRTPDTFHSSPSFYSVPFIFDADEIPVDQAADPVTARRMTFDLDTLLGPSGPLYESESDGDVFNGPLDDSYAQKLSQTPSHSVHRTSDWIQQQEEIMDMLRKAETSESVKSGKSMTTIGSIPTTPLQSHKRTMSEPTTLFPLDTSTPSKKTVRFADAVISPASVTASEKVLNTVESDSVLYHAFQHLAAHAKPLDAYINRESRAEALRMQRRYRRNVHQRRLQGSFSLVESSPQKAEKAWRPNQAPLNSEEEERKAAERATLAGTSRQRRALEQLDLSNWITQASRLLSGGTLLPSSANRYLTSKLRTGTAPRVLDFAGHPTASWGWALAVEHRDAKVYTVVPTETGMRTDWLSHRGPSNHRIATTANAWTLPFPAGFFDVISARSLHTILHMSINRSFSEASSQQGSLKPQDEWHATLSELHRVLAPDGVLHFELLDAEVSAPSASKIAAKGVEFAVQLRMRGYDPCAGRHMLQRFAGSGFGDVRQGWVSLPWASAGKQSHEAVTGLVGSVAWEQWLLRFQKETGKSEDVLLEGVPEALEEARRLAVEGAGQSSAWRMLVGCARKT